MVLDFNVTLANDTVVMVWISSEDAAAVAEKNFRLVHSPSDYFYLVGGMLYAMRLRADSFCLAGLRRWRMDRR